MKWHEAARSVLGAGANDDDVRRLSTSARNMEMLDRRRGEERPRAGVLVTSVAADVGEAEVLAGSGSAGSEATPLDLPRWVGDLAGTGTLGCLRWARGRLLVELAAGGGSASASIVRALIEVSGVLDRLGGGGVALEPLLDADPVRALEALRAELTEVCGVLEGRRTSPVSGAGLVAPDVALSEEE